MPSDKYRSAGIFLFSKLYTVPVVPTSEVEVGSSPGFGISPAGGVVGVGVSVGGTTGSGDAGGGVSAPGVVGVGPGPGVSVPVG